jgi:hypothetical protein
MPTALPSPADELLTRPALEEVELVTRGTVSAIVPEGGLTPLQELLIAALTKSLTGFALSPRELAPIEPDEFARGLASRNLAFRSRVVQNMLLGELILEPIPPAVAARVREFAAELCVDDEIISVAEAYAAGALDVAAADFSRNGYLAAVDPERLRAVHADALAQSWAAVTEDSRLAGKWCALEELPVGTLGRGVADFYRDRGFVYPGLAGSAPPLLAQHDWVHVLAGYGTTLENELEVFAFIARANDDPRGFSLLAMIVSLFETGNLATGAGLFEANPGHLHDEGMAVRVADAMRRGALMRGSQDFLGTDWFTIADRPVAELRREFELCDKSDDAVAAGSRGAWEDAGITPYQLNSARVAAETAGRLYVPWAPDPARA